MPLGLSQISTTRIGERTGLRSGRPDPLESPPLPAPALPLERSVSPPGTGRDARGRALGMQEARCGWVAPATATSIGTPATDGFADEVTGAGGAGATFSSPPLGVVARGDSSGGGAPPHAAAKGASSATSSQQCPTPPGGAP